MKTLKDKIKEKINKQTVVKSTLFGEPCNVRKASFNEITTLTQAEDGFTDETFMLISSLILDDKMKPIFSPEELKNEIPISVITEEITQLFFEANGLGKQKQQD